MSLIRRLDTHHKLYASFALLLCLSMGLSLWMLGQLGQMSLQVSSLTAGAGQQLNHAAQVQAGYEGARTLAWLAIGVTLAAAVLLALWLRGEVDRPVHEAAVMARRVAAGDLSGRIGLAAAGESGQLLDTMQQMNDSLAGMIVKVRSGTESIASSAGQIAAGSMALSARTEEQAASLEQTAASMKQLTVTVRQNAEHAHQASMLAVSASEVALKGGAAVAEVVGTMASINDSSRRIGEITGVIDAIAFQTNILALSAAVEAGRAGEQGRGFAVVASEVRNLAQRSAAAAREIKLLIDDSVAKVGAGTALADKAGKTMHEVVASVDRVANIIGEIADASAEQSAGIEQINQAIVAMDRATQHNAGLVEQSAAAAASMRDQAGSLSRASAAFVLGPEHGAPAPGLRLISSNPGMVTRSRPRAAQRGKPSPVRAVVALPPAVTAMRGGGSAARRDMDWEEF